MCGLFRNGGVAGLGGFYGALCNTGATLLCLCYARSGILGQTPARGDAPRRRSNREMNGAAEKPT
jgi:hypothetical protein